MTDEANIAEAELAKTELMLFEERGAFRHPQLTDQSEGRWYWYPERMSWSLAALKEPQP